MTEKFWIEERSVEPPVGVVHVGGRVGVEPAKELRELAASLMSRGVQHVIMDMSEVTFIASSGIGALIVASGEFDIKKGSFHLVSVSEPVRRAVRLLNLEQFLAMVDTEEQARERIQAAI
jgi:anti-sigma B factor antagonist